MTDNADNSVDQTTDQTGAADGGADGGADRTFTQADVDRMMKHRVGEALSKQKAQFGDYDDLKKKAAEFDQLQEAQKTELEKAQERAAQLEQQAKESTARAQEAVLRSAVIAEAARKNVVDPDAAFALLDRTSLQFADDGTPTNVAEAMDSLLQTKTYLVGGARGSADMGARSGGTGEPAQVTADQIKGMSPEAVLKAEQEGRLNSLMTGS
jgi:hypothetical protein